MASKDKSEKAEVIRSPVETVKPVAPVADDAAPVAADVDSITEQLGSASPTPNDAAILAAAQKEDDAKAQYAEYRDSRGNRFDPEIHVTDSDGSPILTKLKKLRMRPGRKSGGTNAKKQTGSIALGTTQTQSGLTASQKMQARATGEAAAGALITLGVVLGGDEWNPQIDETHGLDERQNLSHAFGDYFEQKEMTDIPPGVALTIAISAYAIPRFTMPKTQTRMQRLKVWVAQKIAARKMRKKDNGAQSDIRDDRKRKDDDSKSTRRET